MHTYLVCFDISSDEQRYRIGVLLGNYGVRVQRSVFEIAVDSLNQLQTLQQDLKPYVADGDDLRFYHLCLSCRQDSVDIHHQRVAQFPMWVLI
jgi:CRISPR-associated endonuclease Cas2